MIGHLVSSFDGNASHMGFMRFKAFLKFVFCFTGTQDQNRSYVVKQGDNLIIVAVKLVIKTPIPSSVVLLWEPLDSEAPEYRMCFSTFAVTCLISSV